MYQMRVIEIHSFIYLPYFTFRFWNPISISRKVFFLTFFHIRLLDLHLHALDHHPDQLWSSSYQFCIMYLAQKVTNLNEICLVIFKPILFPCFQILFRNVEERKFLAPDHQTEKEKHSPNPSSPRIPKTNKWYKPRQILARCPRWWTKFPLSLGLYPWKLWRLLKSLRGVT